MDLHGGVGTHVHPAECTGEALQRERGQFVACHNAVRRPVASVAHDDVGSGAAYSVR
jgi:hypothetical protein